MAHPFTVTELTDSNLHHFLNRQVPNGRGDR